MKYLWIFGLIAAGIISGGCSSDLPPYPVDVKILSAAELAEEVPVNIPDSTAIKKELSHLQKAPDILYRITPGDRFSFSVYENLPLSINDFVVAPDGNISLPLIGLTKIGGLSLEEAHTLLREKVTKYVRDPKVSLIPNHIQGYAFTITGKVNKPGRYPLDGQLRILDAVAIAQGFAIGKYEEQTMELADLETAYVSRGGRILPVDFSKLMGGDSLYNIPLCNSDYIHIPSTADMPLYVIGEVNRPRQFRYQKDMSLLKAISHAGGLKLGHSEDALIIRGGVTNPKVYRVNINDLTYGIGYDVALKSEDIVFVPQSGFRQYNDVVHQIIPTLQAVNLLLGPFGNAAGYFNIGNN